MDGNQKAEPFRFVELANPTSVGVPKATWTEWTEWTEGLPPTASNASRQQSTRRWHGRKRLGPRALSGGTATIMSEIK